MMITVPIENTVLLPRHTTTMFGTSGIRGPLTQLPPSKVLEIGRAVGRFSDQVLVGRDGRHTGKSFTRAFVAGAESAGCRVLDAGLAPTHAVAWGARRHECRAAVITASHNPPGDNGVKVFDPDGIEAGDSVERRIEEGVDDASMADWDSWTQSEDLDLIQDYLDAAEAYVDASVDLRVAVDCGNGVGALTTPPLLRRLGCEVVTVNAHIDGGFPGRPSKPSREALAGFREFIAQGDFDLGIAHDGDADRTVVVEPGGEVTREDALIAVLARERVVPGDAVLTTPNTSGRIDELVESQGGRVLRAPLGGLPSVLREEDVVFAAEPWKHVFPDWGGWVDGSVAAAEFARLAAQHDGLEDLLKEVGDVSVRKTDVRCPEDRKSRVMEELKRSLSERYDAEVDTSHGVRLDFGDGDWLLVRPSGTEPLIRVYAEGDGVFEEAAELVRRTVSENE